MIKNFSTYLNLEISAEKQDQLEKFAEIFREKNSQINLSSIRDEAGIYEKHLADSLLPLKHFNWDNLKILDLGSGGGFPAIPLAIMYPNAQITALDSVGKKMKAVQDMADQLGLKNLNTIHGRIEEFGQNKSHREKYDLVVARALAPWTVLLEYCIPFVHTEGKFVAYQGPAILDDLDKFEDVETRLGGEITQVVADKIGENERIFVEISKFKHTSKKYPRENGVPRQLPLK